MCCAVFSRLSFDAVIVPLRWTFHLQYTWNSFDRTKISREKRVKYNYSQAGNTNVSFDWVLAQTPIMRGFNLCRRGDVSSL